MKSLVTGGAGFIGSHLVGRLLSEGHEVIVLDNFAVGQRENLTHLRRAAGLRLYQVDITEAAIQPYLEGIDWVFHLAALADIVPSIEQPLEYHRNNVSGTVNLLEACRWAGVKRFVYTASSSCYGIPDIFPTPETANIRPEYPYALTKYQAEQCVLHWGKVYKLSVLSLRLFNVYGPRARTSGGYGAVIGVFLAQKLHDKPFTVLGDGSQTRDFIFVTDAVNALVMAAQSNIENEVFNVGSGNSCSINHIVELLGGDAIYIPRRPGEPDRAQADISKIKKALGWQPQVSLQEGVKVLLENIDYWRDAPVWTPAGIAEATKQWNEYLS